MIGFILPNEGSDRPLEDFAVTVDAVEKATVLDFFSALPIRTSEHVPEVQRIFIPREAYADAKNALE